MQTILIVDDNADIRALQKMLLEMEGYRVLTASSGAAGIKTVQEEASIALILLDVQMDDMNGPDFVQCLKQDHPEIYARSPIVMVTAQSDPSLVDVRGFIPKMSDIGEFVKRVQQFLA